MQLQKDNTFIAKTFYGLEDVLAQEIRALGAENIEIINRAVKFTGDKKMLYKANLVLRTALRILVPIKKLNVYSYDDLYKKTSQIDWEEYLSPHHTFFIDSFVNSKEIDHSHFAALKLKDAIADHFKRKYNIRPSVNKDQPNYKINLHIYKNQCTLSLDSTGDSLHKRGYKVINAKAPLNEVLAAGMIQLSNWDKNKPLIDPMCGSGTLPIEAALLAMDIPPGVFRKKYGFTEWQNYDKNLHNDILANYQKNESKNVQIYGSDISEIAIDKSVKNAENAGLNNIIKFETKAFENFNPEKYDKGIVIMNPPYDIKLKKESINEFYKKIGDHLKNNFKGFDVWIFSGNKNAIKSIGLHANKKITLYNGALPCKFLKYNIYEGSLKKKKI
jgi:putative N6-adenine-specific DNA methylase